MKEKATPKIYKLKGTLEYEITLDEKGNSIDMRYSLDDATIYVAAAMLHDHLTKILEVSNNIADKKKKLSRKKREEVTAAIQGCNQLRDANSVRIVKALIKAEGEEEKVGSSIKIVK